MDHDEDDDLERPTFESKKKEDKTPIVEFKIRPDLDVRFKPSAVKEVISTVLHSILNGKIYNEETVEPLIKSIANKIRTYLEGEVCNRYKLVVNVVLGEQRGAGLSCAARCLWDNETDGFATLTFTNESLFCVATVFGIYYY